MIGLSLNLIGLAALVAGAVTLWQPKHFRMAVGIFLLIDGVVKIGLLHL